MRQAQVTNWNVLPSVGQDLREVHQAKKNLDIADSILANMSRMGQDKTPAFHQWKSIRASRANVYHRMVRARQGR